MGELPKRWTHGGFAAFRQGEFDNGGDNLYVTRARAPSSGSIAPT